MPVRHRMLPMVILFLIVPLLTNCQASEGLQNGSGSELQPATGNNMPPAVHTTPTYQPSTPGGAEIKAPSPLEVSGSYLIALHGCDENVKDCHDPSNHQVYLAQSIDGDIWTLVPGWEPYQGSVPDVIRRGDMLYIYAAGHNQLLRYDLLTKTSEMVGIVRVDDLPGGFVDPSLTIDEQGRLVLFFVYGQPGGAPGSCSEEDNPCEVEIGSATEVVGSDGSRFTLDPGARASMLIDIHDPVKTMTDPDIFFDGRRYLLYISHGPSVSVWTADGLRDSYSRIESIPDGMLTWGIGGVPAGYFDSLEGEYWTLTHAEVEGETIIQRARHTDFSHQLTEADFEVMIRGTDLGEELRFLVASPGFGLNQP